MNSHKTFVIIGGGAAGFFGAINCAIANPKSIIYLIEKSSKLLSKVRISGGGRCNVTHSCFDTQQLAHNYPRGNKELLGAFNRFSVQDTIAWFAKRGIQLKTEADGRMFPISNTSETIVNCFLEEAKKHNVNILLSTEVDQIQQTNNSEFELLLSSNKTITANAILIACGGMTKPEHYNWITQLGHTIYTPVPSLFTFNIADKKLTSLMGASVENVTVKIPEIKLSNTGPLLITHWGVSGPAILKLSAWGARDLSNKNYNFKLQINWLFNQTEQEVFSQFEKQKQQSGSKIISNLKPSIIPNRLWDYLLNKSNLSGRERIADITKKQLMQLVNSLVTDEYAVNGKSTFKEEFVTCGGINLKEIDFKTMQSKIIPGLFFAGEVLNIDAITGGFNFQSAWTTSWIASQSIA